MYGQVVSGIAAIRWPSALRAPVCRVFSKLVGANVQEAARPLEEYQSLGEFFARELRPDARPISGDAQDISSPCDGVVSACGRIDAGTLVQAKGHTYALSALLANADEATAFLGGSYVTIYLSPKDYHRVHTPVAGTLSSYREIPGALYPVRLQTVARVDSLYVRNERVVLQIKAPHGPCAIVMVAAVGVGNIWLRHWGTSGHARTAALHPLKPEAAVQRGDELGAFKLGSTVIAVFPQGAALQGLSVGDVVKLGQPIGRWESHVGE